MIRVKFQVLGGHTHIVVRTGYPETSMALCGRLIMDNHDADVLLGALQASTTGRISVLEGGEL